MLARYAGPGLLGLGITALIAGFMSGMAGNVSAFATVWTYDIYGAKIDRKATDKHYVKVGRWWTVLGVVVSIGTAYLCSKRQHHGLRSGTVQLLHGADVRDGDPGNALEAGDKSRRVLGTVCRHACLDRHVGVGEARSRCSALYRPELAAAQDQAQNMFRALWCCLIGVDRSGSGQPGDQAERRLRTGRPCIRCDKVPSEGKFAFYQRPLFWAGVTTLIFIVINVYFW